MYRMIMVLTLHLVVIAGIGSSCANPPATRHPASNADSSAKGPALQMVHIFTVSPGGLSQLRAMPIDIIRVRPAPGHPGENNTLNRAVIVEAVVLQSILPKLRAKGFHILEIVPKEK